MQQIRVRAALIGPTADDLVQLAPLFAEELGHLDASFTVDRGDVVATLLVSAADATSATHYVEDRIGVLFRSRGLDWRARVLDTEPNVRVD